MSTKPNTTSIGLFIVIGVALGVGGLLLFSSSKLFSRTEQQIIYFDNSLNGLDEGAPVKYRGVTIGAVKRVMLRYNQALNDLALPVIIEVDEKLLRERMGDQSVLVFAPGSMERQVRDGLRAKLQTESLVTGVLYIDLDREPNSPPPVFHQLKKIYVEVPSEPTDVQQLINSLATLDIKSMGKNLNDLLANLNTSISNMHLAELSASLKELLVSVNRLAPQITNDLDAAKATLNQYQLLGENLNGRIDPLADSVTNTLVETDRTLIQVRGAAQNLRMNLAPDAPLASDLDQTLTQISSALQSLSPLLDYLQQHPNALITGREQPEKKP